MSPTIRVDNEVMGKLQQLAVKFELIFGTPNAVLRRKLGIDQEGGSGLEDKSSSHGKPNNGLPSSRNPALQGILDRLLAQLNEESGEPLQFEQSDAGRWVSRPENFLTIKPQERALDIAFTVYGSPEIYKDLGVSFEIKSDQNSYSRFKINKIDQVPEAITVIGEARKLRQNKRRR